MKYRDENGVFQDLYLPPTGDTLPIGTVVEYSGTTIPYGWESYSTGKIRKTTQTVGVVGTVADEYTEDTRAVYNAPYINDCNKYSTDEVFTGKYWIDGKKIYRKIVEINGLPNNTSTAYDTNITNGILCKFVAYGKLTSGDTNILMFPYTSPYASSGNVALNVKDDASKVNITTQTDRTSASVYVIIEYTKTTD